MDFLLQFGNEVIPLEVKSGENTRSRSLTSYAEGNFPKLKVRFSMKNMSHQDDLVNVPLFLADRAKEILEMAFKR